MHASSPPPARFRKTYPSDVSDEEWAFVAPYLTLMNEDAAQRKYPLRDLFDALRWIVRAGAPWRMMPGDLPPWETVYQQTQRWIGWGCFEAIVHDVRELLRHLSGTADWRWHFASLRWLTPLLASRPWLQLDGAGDINAALKIDAGQLAPGSRVDVTLFVNNLGNVDRYGSGYTDGTTSYYYPLPLRNLYLQVRAGF